MEYRKIPKDGQKISTIGIGGSNLHDMSLGEMRSLTDYAADCGVNLIDLAVSYSESVDMVGAALKGKRHKFMWQFHLGMTFPNGQYVRTRNPSQVKKGFEDQLKRMNTDYADMGFIHYIDEEEDLAEVLSSGIIEYALKLKDIGSIRYLGFASHDVGIARKLIKMGVFDLCMFSLNAAYDLDPINNIPFEELDMAGQDILAMSRERSRLYEECEKLKVGIQVMKPCGGGTLLNSGTSPFGRAMTVHQCLQYALDRPAVVSVLLGVSGKAQMEDAANLYSVTKEERDYSFIASLQHKDMDGTCVYCNHCLPCPSNIDIGAVHKYLDLYLAGDRLAKEHYLSLEKRANDCIRCGSCERNCPFHVNIMDKMSLAAESMG